MKKLILMALVAVGMASCVKDVDFDPQAVADGVTNTYNEAFVKTFGEPAPNQTWGFSSSSMRGVDANANMWGQTWDCVPNVNLTAEELAELKELLSPGKETYNTNIFPYENYWVSQVYKGQAPNEEYTATDKDGKATNSKVIGSQQMDYLIAHNQTEVFEYRPEDNWTGAWYTTEYEHIGNFNNGNNTNSVYDENFTDPNTGSHNHEGTTLMVNMSLDGITATNQFGFHDSYGTSHEYNNYLIVYYKGYWYVGFDYEMHKDVNNPGEAKDVERDWCFTDWIVRITPAYAKGTTPKEWEFLCRVFAEDLSATDATDFDFNDVVFDVYENGSDSAKIVLQAAGGTLPLYVGGVEVHGAFAPGYATNVMINTGAKANVNGAVAEPFYVKGVFVSNDHLSDVNKNILVKVTKFGVDVPLLAERGKPAAKFAVNEQGVAWADERQDITEKYSNFNSWVNEGTPEKWWK